MNFFCLTGSVIRQKNAQVFENKGGKNEVWNPNAIPPDVKML